MCMCVSRFNKSYDRFYTSHMSAYEVVQMAITGELYVTQALDIADNGVLYISA